MPSAQRQVMAEREEFSYRHFRLDFGTVERCGTTHGCLELLQDFWLVLLNPGVAVLADKLSLFATVVLILVFLLWCQLLFSLCCLLKF